MHWWPKSSKEGKSKSRKGRVDNTIHGNFRIVSEEKGPRSGTSRRPFTDDTLSQTADTYSVNYHHPSPSLEVSCSMSSRSQPVPFQREHHRATHLVDSGIGKSKVRSRERGFWPSSLCSFIKPKSIIYTPDGKYIDMDFTMIDSISTTNSSGCDNQTHRHLLTDQVSNHNSTIKTATKCSSRAVHSREIMRPSNSLLNNQSVSIYPESHPKPSFSAPNSTLSSPLVTPRRAMSNDPFISSGFGSGKSHTSTSFISTRYDSYRTDHILAQSSIGEDVSELINRQHRRCSPERSPALGPRKATMCSPECSSTPSPKMPSAHNNSRVNNTTISPLHRRVTGACPERSKHWSNDKRRESYRLPLPPEKTSRDVPISSSYSTSPKSHVPQSPVKANNHPSPALLWKKGKLIGCGTFGQVYLGFNCVSGQMCAMKEVTLYSDDPKSNESAQQLGQEIALLSQLYHPNIVEYYDAEMVDDNIYIYLEYVPGGSIHKLLQDFGPLDEVPLRRFTHQILSGLAYLHARRIVHRDVKGANILLQSGGCVKLADFGMAKRITGDTARLSFKGSPYWIAPEVVRNSNANISVDIWSLGCTVLEMVTGKPPWGNYEEVAALFKIGHTTELPPIPRSLSEEGKDFIRKCLQRDPLQRPTAAQLLEHPFVKSVIPPEIDILSPQPLSRNPANLLARMSQFLNQGAIHQSRGRRTVTPTSTIHSPNNRFYQVSPRGNLVPQLQSQSAGYTSQVSPRGNVVPQSQSPGYMSSRNVSPPIFTPQSSSGIDIGAFIFRRPRGPQLQHTDERLSPTSVATPHGTPSSSIRPHHHSPQSPNVGVKA